MAAGSPTSCSVVTENDLVAGPYGKRLYERKTKNDFSKWGDRVLLSIATGVSTRLVQIQHFGFGFGPLQLAID